MNAHHTLNLRKMTALPPLKPSHLPCPLQTKASSPETLSRASSFQGSPSSIEALVSPETQNSHHCPQKQTPWQNRPPGAVSDPSCQVSSHVPQLNLVPSCPAAIQPTCVHQTPMLEDGSFLHIIQQWLREVDHLKEVLEPSCLGCLKNCCGRSSKVNVGLEGQGS